MKISILGAAGTLGSCAAFHIGVNRLAEEIVLIDPWEGMLHSQWMDLSASLDRLDILVRQGIPADMQGSDIVVVASAAPAREVKSQAERLPDNLAVLRDNGEHIRRYCPDAIVITETNPVDGLNYAMYLMSSHRDRRRYIGYCLNDTIRFRMWSARALGVQTSRVGGLAIGEHGIHQVLLFSTLTVDGNPVAVNKEFKNRLRQLPAQNQAAMESLNPRRTYGWMCAMGVVEIIQAIQNDSHAVIPCNVVLQGEYGHQDTTCGVPAVLGHRGVENIRVVPLETDEEEGLQKSVEAVRPQMDFVTRQLDSGK